MAGVLHWGVGLQLYLELSGNRMNMGTFKSVQNASRNIKYTDGESTIEMESKGSENQVSRYLTQLTTKSGQKSEYLNCYIRQSGLE